MLIWTNGRVVSSFHSPVVENFLTVRNWCPPMRTTICLAIGLLWKYISIKAERLKGKSYWPYITPVITCVLSFASITADVRPAVSFHRTLASQNLFKHNYPLSEYNNFMQQQVIESQGLLTDCWPHVHLSKWQRWCSSSY